VRGWKEDRKERGIHEFYESKGDKAPKSI